MKKLYEIVTDKVNDSLLLAVMTDIHFEDNYNMKRLDYLLERYKESKPDGILVLGDIVNQVNISTNAMQILVNYLKKLASIAPVYIVMGNHDKVYRIYNFITKADNSSLVNAIKKIKNVHLLENELVKINDKVMLLGLDFPYEYYMVEHEGKREYLNYARKYINLLDDNKFNIILQHSPHNIWDNKDALKYVDLALSGHMHNGCIPTYLNCLPGNRGLVGVVGHHLKFGDKECRNKKVINERRTGIVFSSVVTFSGKGWRRLNVFYPVCEQYVVIKEK